MSEAKARKVVKARSEGRCEVCLTAPATDMHHRRNRSQGGRWTPENLMHLCHSHHMHITVNPKRAREQGWTVPSWADPATTAVWVAGREFVFLTSTGNYETKDGEVA
jgi:hypothetical protein